MLDRLTSVAQGSMQLVTSHGEVTDDPSQPSLPDHYSRYTRPPALAGQVIAIAIISIISIVGNCLLVLAVMKTSHLRTVTNGLTINLALTDLGVAVIVLPGWIISLTLGLHSTREPFPRQLCQLAAFITVLLILVSISTLAGISLDRYFSICHPMRYPLEMTSVRVYIAVAYIWIQSTFLASTPFYGWGEYTWRPQAVPICNPLWEDDVSYAAFLLICGIAVPFALLLFSYYRIIQEARGQAQRIQNIQLQFISQSDNTPCGSRRGSTESNRSQQLTADPNSSRRPSLLQRVVSRTSISINNTAAAAKNFSKNIKTLKTVFIVVGAFFCCWGPYVGLNLWLVNSPPETEVPYIADLLVTLLAFFNSAVNPYVFIFLTRDLRGAVRMLLVRHVPCLCFAQSKMSISTIPAARSVSQVNLSSAVDDYRFVSRGSCDSGVDLDLSQIRESPKKRMTQSELSSSGGLLGPRGSSASLVAPGRSQYLGDELALQMTPIRRNCTSPVELTIVVPTMYMKRKA